MMHSPKIRLQLGLTDWRRYLVPVAVTVCTIADCKALDVAGCINAKQNVLTHHD